MSKLLLTEYYELCPNGKCDDLLTEEEKSKTAKPSDDKAKTTPGDKSKSADDKTKSAPADKGKSTSKETKKK